MEKLKSLQLRFLDKAKQKHGKKLKILVIVLIAISLLIASLIVKDMVSNWYWDNHGLGFYWTDPTLFETVYTGKVWYIEAYVDASYYYEPYLQAFRYENWNPYAGGPGPLNGYAYGPMFIFGIYFISLIISMLFPQMPITELVPLSVKWTHIAFDSLSVVMVYLVVIFLKSFKKNELKRHTFGILAAAIFACMPINLIYVDSLYLNTPQMTFFTLLSLLLFMKEKYRVGAFILSVAWLTKQMSLFLLIPWFFIVWKKKSLKSAFMDFLFPFLLTTILISLPWLIMTPRNYLRRVFGPGSPVRIFDVNTALTAANNGRTVTLAHSFLYLENEALALFYHKINLYMIPFVFFYLLAVLFAYFNGDKIGNNESYLIILSTWILVSTHLFISRGVYKYYNAFLTPFVVISLLVFFDDILPKTVQQIPKTYKRLQLLLIIIETRILKRTTEIEIKIIEIKPKQEKIISNVFLALTFLGSCFAFYYFNWILIVNTRFLHPLYLLILFVVISLLIPPSIYLSLFKAGSYKMIWTDLVYIYNETVKGIVSAGKSTQSFFVGIYKKTKNFVRKSENEEDK
ncbi:MAG: hypothetical protein GOP50_13320 [Candidatus Heimdallarchaeota archaeon]|nr:hypothetical protein [Candidatus Heimdallarchaeota archaeon]